jgi:hypothetical protein
MQAVLEAAMEAAAAEVDTALMVDMEVVTPLDTAAVPEAVLEEAAAVAAAVLEVETMVSHYSALGFPSK